jgi:sec-independent protein translocase protein TatB
MFDFNMSEIALIGVVALVLIGPKDLPIAVKAVTDLIKRARRMASEFQTHVDEMVKDADLGDLKKTFDEVRNFDLKGLVENTVDKDGSLRATFAEDLMNPATPDIATTSVPELTTALEPEPVPPVIDYPDFIPPHIAHPPEPPAFLPPGVTLTSR